MVNNANTIDTTLHLLTANAPPEADEIPEAENRLPSGWWLIPAVLTGGMFWAVAFRALFG
ncbi:hypothetical protein EYE35_01260 [Cereibacter sphaeroides]|nr:hypothetical protein EYE35_01260 [Cereibacter sphaeroides]